MMNELRLQLISPNGFKMAMMPIDDELVHLQSKFQSICYIYDLNDHIHSCIHVYMCEVLEYVYCHLVIMDALLLFLE